MIDYRDLLEKTKQKYQLYSGDIFTEYFKYNKEGSDIIALNNIKHFDEIDMSETQIETCKQISLTTTVMDRADYLNKSLKTWLKFPFKKIVIVDWSSSVPVEESLKEHFGFSSKTLDDRIEIVRIENEEFYEHSKARNEKMKHVDGWVLSIDSDVLLSPKFASSFVLDENHKRIYLNDVNRSDKALFGTSLFHKDEFDSVGGCNGNFHGWGVEDVDLFERMIRNGCKTRIMVSFTMYHIPHSDFLRSINTKYDDVFESMATNNSLQMGN